MDKKSDRLIVALDVSRSSDAQKIVAAVGESASTYKVGKQLFTAEGPQIVRDLVASGRKVFLDLKFHDIPNTVGKAVQSASELGVAMLTVHASGGTRMLKAAVEAGRASKNPLLILAVTVLTSMNDADLQELGMPVGVADQVLRLAGMAQMAGCGGIVTSAHESKSVRSAMGAGFAIVVPGIRPAGSETGDQARVVTPAEAIRNGASHIVVGRPITGAADPAKAAREIVAEMEGVEIAV